MANSDEVKRSLNISNNGGEEEGTSNVADGEDDEFEAVESDDDGDEDDDDDEAEDEQVPPQRQRLLSRESQLRAERSKLENLIHRLSNEKVPLRVHDVIIKGNSKTKDHVIEAEVEAIRKASTMQELLEASGIASAKLQGMEIFDAVRITLDSGPPELPGTANVIVEVVETKSPLSGECGAYTKPAVMINLLFVYCDYQFGFHFWLIMLGFCNYC